jgi:hypothetical protein
MPKGRISFKVSAKAAKALKALAAQKPKPKFRVIGKVKRGKIEIDSNELSNFAKGIPKKDVVFVALNAPFKTRPLIVSV